MISASFKTTLKQSLSEKLKSTVQIKSFTPIGGGCINDAQKMDIRQRTSAKGWTRLGEDSMGRTSAGVFFVKWNDAKKYPGMFEAEAKGLELLRSSNTLKIPAVPCLQSCAQKENPVQQ